MKRYFVCRAYMKWKGKMYYKGDLLPENFTHHDKARSIYNSRIGVCDVPEEKTPTVSTPVAPMADASKGAPISGQPAGSPSNTSTNGINPSDDSSKGVQGADGKPTFNFSKPLTGTSK